MMFPTFVMFTAFVMLSTPMTFLIAAGPVEYATPAGQRDGKQAQH